ncbi:flagellar assembly protein FliW [Cohnella sp. GCM10020058]|uniref:flagellar assembly protein FliW n=1 Tax=Cohnella sp. GCM10020058 TaxID=3317330 RepID=UPI00363CBF61
MFRHLYDKPISMRGSILGFPELNEFMLLPIEDSDLVSPFAYLQSSAQDEVGFLVADPFQFCVDYEFKIGEQDIKDIEATAPEGVIVMAIVKIGDPFDTSTINLMAPLIINVDKLLGRQVVLSSDKPYTTKMPIGSPVKEGER